MKSCWLCGRNGATDPLDRHHVFSGANRKKSEQYGLVVDLCHSSCHIFGAYAVHRNAETRRMLQQQMQIRAMFENNWTIEDFIKEFGKNYLEENDDAESHGNDGETDEGSGAEDDTERERGGELQCGGREG